MTDAFISVPSVVRLSINNYISFQDVSSYSVYKIYRHGTHATYGIYVLHIYKSYAVSHIPRTLLPSAPFRNDVGGSLLYVDFRCCSFLLSFDISVIPKLCMGFSSLL